MELRSDLALEISMSLNMLPEYLIDRLVLLAEQVERNRMEIAKILPEGWNDEIEVNEHGGKQSKLSTRLDLLPPAAILEAGRILKLGADKYGIDNWRSISVDEHKNHALTHLFSTDDREDHLSHACVRLLMALEISLVGMEGGKSCGE